MIVGASGRAGMTERTMRMRRKLSDANRVWNRACGDNLIGFREGDVALAAMLLVHGLIQNGGVCHAFDLTPDELLDGIKGYEFFGLHELVAIIRPHRGEEEEYNKRYYRLANDENVIMAKFEEMFREHPERFAPLAEAADG
jgi:hypothetical protein